MSEEAVVTAPEAPAASAPSAPASPAPAASGQDTAQKPAESATATPEGGEKKPETPETAEKRGTRRFERKLDKAYRRAAEAEARASIYEKQLSETRQPQADPNAPRLESFKDIEEYAQAKAKYESERVLNEHRSKQQAETQKQHQARLTGEWEEKVSRAEDKYEDFGDVVGDLSPSTPWAIAIMRAENGDDIAYHLGRNMKEAQRIAGLDPYSQIIAIGRLSATLAAAPPKPPKLSQAPAPINPISGGAPSATSPTPDKDFGAWMKARQKQLYGTRR